MCIIVNTNSLKNFNMAKLTKKEKEENKYQFLVNLGKQYSKKLRENQTPWETKIYKILKDLHYNFKFQVPYIFQRKKLYILDFWLVDFNIVLEIDGKSTHGSKEQIKADNQRSRHLKKDGFHIVRLWNSQVSRYTEKEIKEVIDNKLKMLKDLNKIK